ncbi:hypothetical protein BHQ23_01645 [Mycobacterium gordonae]|uniref:Lipoprotein LpqS n=1 Tax=Mycobacterium gordonae TaxID=1778 RepID=A0A1X1VJY3_MYCGO|nr:hypothetical protein [Mycobacterium gordonae]ODR24322.1 hypothetical protein BHQ23_01645 [Mycobacterium gordonae]ORV69326.1 hypothetical protein AWC08_06505 [Mycobacterium gordonae]
MAVAAAAWLLGWLLVIGAHSTSASPPALPGWHAAHVLAGSVGGEFTPTVDHPHAADGSSAATHPEQLVTAVLPRSAVAAPTLLGLGVVVIVALSGCRVGLEAPAGRGPPRYGVVHLTGQDRLTWLGLSRR